MGPGRLLLGSPVFFEEVVGPGTHFVKGVGVEGEEEMFLDVGWELSKHHFFLQVLKGEGSHLLERVVDEVAGFPVATSPTTAFSQGLPSSLLVG